MTQELLFPDFSPPEHGADELGRWADAWLERIEASTDVPPSLIESAERSDVLSVRRFDSPLGPLLAAASPRGLALLEFVDRDRFDAQLHDVMKRYGMRLLRRGSPTLDGVQFQLERYFDGKLRAFDLPLDVKGTPFQLDVWEALRSIPYGTTNTYADVAEAIGRPTATRAVGAANGRNRIAIVLPCHRVIGADGTLTGYGAGVWRKRRLLELEAR